MSDFGRDRSNPASNDQREGISEEHAGGAARNESRGMLGPAIAAYGSGVIQRKIAERAARRSAAASEPASGGGEALPGPVQAKMEGSFGADFSDVRVHQGSQAEALGARAFARGSDLHFAPGQYDPSSTTGQTLIGHELTHVVQQRAGRVATQGKDGPINNDPALEGEADQMGARAARGERAVVSGSSSGLQRKGADSPIQCDGADVEKLVKKGKGGLARESLEKTVVTGQDEQGHDRSSPRADGLAAAISKGAFQATADVLAGPSFDSQPSFQQAFVASWKSINKTYDDKGAQGAALLDPLLTAKFKGNKLGYLQDLRANGHSSPEWLVLMCLGEVEGGLAHDDAVVRAFERAAEQLDNAKFQAFWTKVEKPLRKSMHHLLTSDRRLNRLLARKNLKVAEAPVEQAEAELQKAEAAEKAADTQKEKSERAKQHGESEVTKQQDTEKAKKGELVTAQKVEKKRQRQVDREQGRVDQAHKDVTASDQQLLDAQTKRFDDVHALEKANQALLEANEAYQEAQRFLALRLEANAAREKRVEPPKSDGADAQVTTSDESGGAPENKEEVQRLEARTEQAQLRAAEAKQYADEVQAEIERLEAELVKSEEGVKKAETAKEHAHESLAEHQKELKKRTRKLKAAKRNVKTAEKAAETAKENAEKAEQAVQKLDQTLKHDEAELTKAQKKVTDKKQDLATAKGTLLNSGTEVAYLAALIESIASKLNDFDREAIHEVSEWAHEHAQAVPAALTAGSPFLVALDKHIKKARNKEFLKALIKGDKSNDINNALTDKGPTKLGFDEKETKGTLDEVTMTALIVDREAQKHQDKKVQIRVGPAKISHVVLKQQLLSMSPDAREQYLAFSTDTPKADLAKTAERDAALVKLDHKLETACGVVDAKERERMLALFKVAGAGVNYSKLYGLVHTTDKAKYAKDDDFGKKALSYITKFSDPEFYQLRHDADVLDAVKVCTKKAEISQIVGGLDAQGDITALGATHADKGKALTDALHQATHWSTLINVEMDKWRLSPRDERNRNDVYMYGHRAQQAAIAVAKTKNPGDVNAGKPTHADAKQFVQDVWGGVSPSAQSDMTSQYPDLAKALKAGGEVTVDMVLGSIAKYHVGSWKFHVDKADIKKVIDNAKGRELLNSWSNIQAFTDGKKGLDAPKEREFKRTFVLDVNTDKRTWLDQAVGSESITYANLLRDKFKHAAESDGDFKAGLTEAGYDNTQFNRDQMQLRGLLEKANKNRKGLDFDGISSKGHAQHQAYREVVGTVRDANKDDQALDAHKTGEKEHDQRIDKERDEHFEEHHAKSLDEKKEELELSGEEFEKLRENVRKYTEIAIALIISVAVSAATMGTVPAWAMVLVKVGAVILAEIVKEVVGNAITGDKLNAQKLVTNVAVASIGTAAGGFAGMGFEQNAGEMNTFLKEFIKGTVVSTTKTFSKDAVKGAAERNAGGLTVSGMIKNQIMGFVVSAASSQIAAGVMEEKGLSHLEGDKASHEDTIKPDKDTIDHLNTVDKPDAQHGVDLAQSHVDGAQSAVDGAQHLVGMDTASVSADHTSIASDTSHLSAANEQVATAQQHLQAAQQQYDQAVAQGADKATLAVDQEHLAQAQLEVQAAQHDVSSAQTSLDADQAKLDSDETRLGSDEATLESDQQALETADAQLEAANTHLEDINKQIEDLETKIKPDEDIIASDETKMKAIEVIGKKIDDAADKILDVPADLIMEAIGERSARKLEKVTPKKVEPPSSHGKKK